MSARALFLIAGVLFLTALARDRFDLWVDETRLPPLLAQTSVEVRAADGMLLRPYVVEDGRWRLDVSPEGVDPLYLEMLLRYEDKRFRDHVGVDPVAMLRAAGQAVLQGRVVSGGSTLTMQVARLLENSGTGAVPGKLRQIRLALALERVLSKDDILKLYLVHAPFGGNLEGVRAASLSYFGKEPRRLSAAEAALLVALPQAPESRRPDRRPEGARLARNRVLARMADAGVLDEVLQARAEAAPVPTERRAMPQHAPHLADRLRRAHPAQPRHHTTLNGALQQRLEARARDYIGQAGRGLSAAMMVVDHSDGRVLAALGGPSLDGPGGHLDMTQAARSPGSTLKPLVYGLAFDSGRAHPKTLIADVPVDLGGYTPANFDGTYRGDVTLEVALQASLNTPVVRLAYDLTPARITAAMGQAGMTPEVPGGVPGLAIVLGGLGVSLEDLVRLYGAMARGGQSFDLQVTDLPQDTESPRQVLSARAAWQVSDILSRTPPPPGAPSGWLAYKTGTSYGHRDTWAVGYDGRHVIAVWLGRVDGTAVPGVFGAELAAPLLFEAFQLLKDAPAPLRDPPKGLRLKTHADLPPHLRRFGPAPEAESGFEMAFPPDGSVLAADQVTLKLRAGRPPFTVLLNGAPVVSGLRDRALPIDLGGPGFHRIAVLDARGAAVSAAIAVE